MKKLLVFLILLLAVLYFTNPSKESFLKFVKKEKYNWSGLYEAHNNWFISTYSAIADNPDGTSTKYSYWGLFGNFIKTGERKE